MSRNHETIVDYSRHPLTNKSLVSTYIICATTASYITKTDETTKMTQNTSTLTKSPSNNSKERVDADLDIKTLALKSRPQAFENLVTRYRARLYRHALCIVKEPEAAWDATQEVFVKAMKERRIFDGDFQVKAWLFRVTSNLCYNVVRDRNRRQRLLNKREEEVRPSDQSRCSTSEVSNKDARSTILDAMNGLTENHKKILFLRYYDDLSYSEIAEKLQIKLGTVMSRLSRARNSLGEIIGPSHPLVMELVY